MQTEQAQVIDERYVISGPGAAYGPVELFDAHDRQLDRPVTIQILSAEAAEDPTASRAFLRHQQIAGSIHNCPIFAVYDAGNWMGRPYSVMEREKGAHPGTIRRPGYPPDNALVLRVTRQVAEAVECCRRAGLSDWTFAPDAVRVDSNGNGCLSVIEGLIGPHSSSDPAHDAAALAALMRLLLAGSEEAGNADLRAALVPDFMLRLLERIDTVSNMELRTAGDVARAIALMESTALRATQAYLPPPGAGKAEREEQPRPPAETLPRNSPEAPTLAAPVPAPILERPTEPQLQAQAAAIPYAPGEEADVRPVDQGKRWWSPLLAGVALLALLVVAAQPLLRTNAGAAGTAAGASPPAGAAPALAPDVRGKDLDEARDIAGGAGLNLALGEPLYSGEVVIDRVAAQEPPPGSRVAPGSLITVSLSLGPEATPVPPASPVVEEPPAQEPAPQPPPQEERGKKGGKKKGKDD